MILRRGLIVVMAAAVMAIPVSRALHEPGDAVAGAPGGGATQGGILGVAPVEGAEFSGAVARFQNVNHLGGAPPTATIDWGDGSVTAGTVVPGPASGEYVVSGRHTYAHTGTYLLDVVLTYQNDGSVQTNATGDVNVADAPLTPKPINFTAIAGTPVNGAVGGFDDANPNGTVADIGRAVIDWGDGTDSEGTVILSRRGFQVLGTHTYTRAERLPVPVRVIVISKGGAQTTINSTARIVGDPHAAFTRSPHRPCGNQTVTFNASPTTVSPGTRIVDHVWSVRGDFGPFAPPPDEHTHADPVWRKAFGYSRVEMALGMEVDGEIVFPDPPVRQYFRAPIKVILTVTDSTGRQSTTFRVVKFLDHRFRPTQERPEPDCPGRHGTLLSEARFDSPTALARVGDSGRFGLLLDCRKTADCLTVVSARLAGTHRSIGGAAALIAAGKEKRVQVRLSHLGRLLLRRRDRLRVKLVVETINSEGGARHVSRLVTLRARG